jgi:hypothetical protein
MIEHLPGAETPMDEAWAHFGWVAGPGDLPRVTDGQRDRMLSGTAKEWLGIKGL